MSALILLAAGAAVPDYPAREVLAAFATACSGAEDAAVNLASAGAAGWEKLPRDADTPVSELVRAGIAAVQQEKDVGEDLALTEGGEFRKAVAGRTLYLAVSGAAGSGVRTNGCRMFDFDAPRALTDAELHDWSVREPSARQDLPGGIVKQVYNPGLKPGHYQMEVYFVPAGANPIPGFNLRGLGLVASTMEF